MAAVREAAQGGSKVRAVGSGHSFVPLGASEDTLMVLGRLRGIESIDTERRQVTVLGGTKLYHLGKPLREAGLALKNLPDVDRQGVAGAIATGTHGTGKDLGNLSTHVVGLELVDGRGNVVKCSVEERPDLLAAGQVSLGALGIMTRITLQLEPTYRLHETSRRASYEECVDGLERSIADNEHFEFFWVSGLDACLMKTLNKTDVPDDLDESNPETFEGQRIGHWDEIYPSERNTLFNEMEYALPAENGPGCLAELRDLMLGKHKAVTWPLEYRTVEADDIPLSPHFGGPSVTISAHEPAEASYPGFFPDVEAIFRNHSGRPHWGKMHGLTAEELQPLYPKWSEFQKAREELDPQKTFLTPYLQRLLG
jgi:FAD/FMN-containing dehydrogenase